MNGLPWNAALWALAFVAVSAALLALPGLPSRRPKFEGALRGFLLAGTSLGKTSVISLLLSGSFGLNSLFYQVWLGYVVGAWGLIAQGAWALSFILLAKYTSKVIRTSSLHGLLGDRFGTVTKVIAGVTSMVGMMYLLGWEVGIGQSMFEFMLTDGSPESNAATASTWLIVAVVCSALLYTVLGGLRGNALADLLLNTVKIVAVSVCAVVLWINRDTLLAGSFASRLFPSVSTMTAQLGWIGLITNIAFSLAWQFVDMSTWQSVIAGKEHGLEVSTSNLRKSGWAIFVAPGIIGTILGVSLAGMPDITGENILGVAISALPGSDAIVLFVAFVAVIACIMSLVDGLLIANAYTFVIDVLNPNNTLDQLDNDRDKAERIVLITRILLFAIAALAAWGVQFLIGIFGGNLFDFVYVVIITQLSLIGPVLVALLTDRSSRFPMWASILFAAFMGFAASAFGNSLEMSWLINGAGTITIVASVLAAFASSQTTPKQVQQ